MKRSLALAAMLAFSASSLPPAAFNTGAGWPRRDPINTGRRAEKDAAALAKAQAKRDRKAAKRVRA